MKNPVPETRQSLILRLPDPRDLEAWDQFVAIYQPLVYRLARSRGFQDADACEIVQEVLLAVSKAVERWDPDTERGRFRDWLFCIARNLMINFLTRRNHRPVGTGDTRVAEMLNQKPDPHSHSTRDFDDQYRREVFRWASSQVQRKVSKRTWQAFYRTSVEGHDMSVVATEFGMSVGAVHIARSRVLGRLRRIVRTFDDGVPHDESQSHG